MPICSWVAVSAVAIDVSSALGMPITFTQSFSTMIVCCVISPLS